MEAVVFCVFVFLGKNKWGLTISFFFFFNVREYLLNLCGRFLSSFFYFSPFLSNGDLLVLTIMYLIYVLFNNLWE